MGRLKPNTNFCIQEISSRLIYNYSLYDITKAKHVIHYSGPGNISMSIFLYLQGIDRDFESNNAFIKANSNWNAP